MQKAAKDGDDSIGDVQTTGQYYGVDIKVSFSRSGKPQRVHQLSGGQQSLVALALIFAIQRCDPAPFYVFDEIDSALDDTYRLAIAQMIKAQSDEQKIQFIITTHRPEMVQHAHKHYLIEYKNKVSNVVSCNQEDALALLDGEEEVPVREARGDSVEGDDDFDDGEEDV
jgi:structural maintenance of chromosome 3 (chondroitin sulfate proteoglycan 6)